MRSYEMSQTLILLCNVWPGGSAGINLVNWQTEKSGNTNALVFFPDKDYLASGFVSLMPRLDSVSHVCLKSG